MEEKEELRRLLEQAQFAPPHAGGFAALPVKMARSEFGKEEADTLKAYQQQLKDAQLASIKSAMSAAEDAKRNFGKMSTGFGLGLGFERPGYDTASDRARTAMVLEILKKAEKEMAPPNEFYGIAKTQRSTGDILRALKSESAGADIDPMSLSLQERENLNEARKLKQWEDFLKMLRGGF